jgi:hypothetical protein
MESKFISVVLRGAAFRDALVNTAHIVKVRPNSTGAIITFDRMGTNPIILGDLEVADSCQDIQDAMASDKLSLSKRVKLTGLNDWEQPINSQDILLVRGIHTPKDETYLSVVFADKVKGIPDSCVSAKTIESYINGETAFIIRPTEKLELRIGV